MQKVNHAVIKCDTEENWIKAQNYIPPQGTIIVYEYEDMAPKLKIGDGKKLVNDLEFIMTPSQREVNGDTLEL